MPDLNAAALKFLHARRSVPSKTLTLPVPDRAALTNILTAAARSPDHGKLEPWRFIVLEHAALQRIAEVVPVAGARLGVEAEKIAKLQGHFSGANLVVAVVNSPKASDKIPQIEQTYAVGGVCLALVNAALASGWGANWLSGWASHDRQFVAEQFGLASHETIAGLIHIGTASSTPPERPRPDLAAITTWLTA